MLDALAGVAGVETTLYGDGDGLADGMDWRTGSIRIAIMITNSGPHNYPNLEPAYPGLNVTDALAALQAADISAAGIVFSYGYPDTFELFAGVLCPNTDGTYVDGGDVETNVVTIVDEIVSGAL